MNIFFIEKYVGIYFFNFFFILKIHQNQKVAKILW